MCCASAPGDGERAMAILFYITSKAADGTVTIAMNAYKELYAMHTSGAVVLDASTLANIVNHCAETVASLFLCILRTRIKDTEMLIFLQIETRFTLLQK